MQYLEMKIIMRYLEIYIYIQDLRIYDIFKNSIFLFFIWFY